jgi:type II secretory pathway pseudopilin PulG
MRRPNGFTLIEIVLAIAMLMIVLVVAVPSLNGVLADRRLRRSLDGFNNMVREAQERSIIERRSYLLVLRDKQFALRAEGLLRGEDPAPIMTMSCGKKESFAISFPAALEEEPPPAWIFWPSGNCEPAVVSYRGVDGAWTAKYSALTARPELLNYVVR